MVAWGNRRHFKSAVKMLEAQPSAVENTTKKAVAVPSHQELLRRVE